jgi:chemotaxis protein methyltransferase CheR
VFYEGGAEATILLGMEDVTERRALEREKDELLPQKDVLLDELQHRISNSPANHRQHHLDEGESGGV